MSARADNHDAWQKWVAPHVESTFYDVASFKTGRDTLSWVEHDALPDVRGKTLLHLQCHFGMDTLSWARHGAVVTGVDFSGNAIAAAQRLAAEVKLPATFIESDIYALRENLHGQFDIVFTGLGAIGWLDDIDEWARIAAHFVKPGGQFFIFEGHPFAYAFECESKTPGWLVSRSYFDSATPEVALEQGSYADPNGTHTSTTHYWLHELGRIVTALGQAGLAIQTLREHPFVAWPAFPWLEKRADGFWHFPAGIHALPMTYSLLAVKPRVLPTNSA